MHAHKLIEKKFQKMSTQSPSHSKQSQHSSHLAYMFFFGVDKFFLKIIESSVVSHLGRVDVSGSFGRDELTVYKKVEISGIFRPDSTIVRTRQWPDVRTRGAYTVSIIPYMCRPLFILSILKPVYLLTVHTQKNAPSLSKPVVNGQHK